MLYKGLQRTGALRGHSCLCFPWLPPLLSKDLLMVSVRDARPFFTPLTTIITSPTGGYNWASHGKELSKHN